MGFWRNNIGFLFHGFLEKQYKFSGAWVFGETVFCCMGFWRNRIGLLVHGLLEKQYRFSGTWVFGEIAFLNNFFFSL